MKYSRTAIGLLTAQYRSVLKKCLLINLGLFALGAVAATPAAADDPTWTPGTTASSWGDLAVQTDNFMEYLETGVYGEWNRAHSAVTGWGVDQIMAMMAPVASDTDSAIALIKNGTEYSGDTGKFGKGLYDAVGTQISDAISGKLDGTSAAYTAGTAPSTGSYYYTAESIYPTLQKANSAVQYTDTAGYAGSNLKAQIDATLGTAATAAKSTETGITTDDAGLVTGAQVASMNYLTGITSSQVTTALGFTPFNPANIIAADGEASTTNVYSASAIDTKLTGYATTTALGTKLAGTSATYVAGTTPEDGTYYTAGSIHDSLVHADSAVQYTDTTGYEGSELQEQVNDTLGSAAFKGVATSVSDSANLVTAAAVNTALGGKVNNTDLGFDIGTGEGKYASVNAYVNGQGFIKKDVNDLTNYTTTANMNTALGRKLDIHSEASDKYMDITNEDGSFSIEGDGGSSNYTSSYTQNADASGIVLKATKSGEGAGDSELHIRSNGIFYGTPAQPTNEIVTLATAKDGVYDANHTIAQAIASKQDALSETNAGAGIAISDTGVISAKLATTNSYLTADENGLAVNKDDLQSAMTGTIADANTGFVTGNEIFDAGYITKAVDDLDNYTNNTTLAENYAKLADGNKFTGNQQFGVLNGTEFKAKAAIGGNGSAFFGRNDENSQYAFIVQKDGITANQSIAAKAGLIVGNGTAATELTGAKIKGYDKVVTDVNDADTGLASKQAKLTEAANGGDGIAIDDAGVISVDLAADGGLKIDNNHRLQAKIATTVEESNTDLVNSDLLAKQNYVKNGTNAQLVLSPTGNTADLAVKNGSNLVAGININGGDTNSIALTVNDDSNAKKAAIDINENGAFYTRTGTAADADEIVTLGTAANGTYTNGDMSGVSTISGALDALQSSKQGNLTAGNGINIASDTVSVKLKTYTPDPTAYARGNGLELDSDGLRVDLAAYTPGQSTKDSEVAAWVAANATKLTDVYTTAAVLGDKMTIFQNDLFNSNTTKNSIAAELVGYVDPATSPAATDIKDLKQAVQDTAGATADAGLTYDNTTQKLSLKLDGLTADTNTSGLVVGENGLKVNKAATLSEAAADKYFDSATINSNFFNKANIIASDATSPTIDNNHVFSAAAADARFAALNGSDLQDFAADTLSAKTAVVTPMLTFGTGADAKSATGIGSVDGETATALTLATTGYATQEAKAAADKVVSVNSKTITFKNSDGTDETQTYTKAAIAEYLNAKYDFDAIVTATGETAAKNTAVYSQAKSDELLGLKMNTADWTLANDATKLDGAKLGAGTVGFAAINPAAISTSASVAAILADSHSVAEAVEAASDTKLVTEKAVFAGVGAMFNDKQNWMSEVLGYDTAESIAAQLSPLGFEADASGHLGFLQAVSQNKTAIDNIISADTQLEGIQMSDNSATPVAKTVHKIDNSVIYDDNQATGDEDVLATKATVLAALDNPEQDITANKVTANEVDTKALNVAATKSGDENPTKILTAGLDADENVLVTVNGTLSTGSLKTVSANITNLRMFEADENGRKSNLISAQGIKKTVSADGNDNYLITSGGVDAEFTKKVGTLTKNTGTADVPVYTTRSVADMIGVDANGELVFTEAAGVSNIASGDGTKSAPTTIVGAVENLSSALGKIHGLATNNGTATEPNITVNNNKSIFKAGNIVSSVTGETITSNLPTGTSVEEMEVYLDNAIGNIESGDTLVGKAYADEDGNRIKTTYAVDADVVHKAGAETIDGVKTFSNGLKVGADYKLVETDSGKLTVQIGNSRKSAMVVDKAGEFGLYKVDETAKTATPYLKATSGELRAYATNSTDGSNYQYMKSLKDYFYLYSEDATTDPTFSVENATGDLSASKGKFTVVTDTADASKVKVSVAGDIEATGNVKAASLTLPNLDQTTAGATITATAIDNNATAFASATDGTTLATLASVNTLAEKAKFTPADGGTLTKTTIGEAINELDSLKFAKADIVTAWSATTSDTKVASEKLVRDTLDDILDGDTPFTGFTMTNNAATPDDVKMLAIDDGTFAAANQSSVSTFATNATVKSALTALLGGDYTNPNEWLGDNTFKKQIVAEKGIQIGDDYKLFESAAGKLVMSTNDTPKFVYEEGSLGLYATDSNSKNSSYFSILSGSTDPNKVDGMRLSSDGKAYFKALVNQLAVIDPATNKINFSVENATGNVTAKGNAVIAGDLTAGDATKAQLTVDNATNTISMITKDSTDATKAAGFAADGNSAEMQASKGIYDFTFSADVENADKESIAMAVSQEDSSSGNDIILSAVQADKDSIAMGVSNGTTSDMVAGVNVERADPADTSSVNTVEMGTFTHDSTANDDVLTAGVKVEGGNKVSILADNGTTTANPVIEAGYDTTNGNYVTINGNETVTGDFSAAGGDFTVTKDATSGKTTMTLAGDEVVNGKATFNGTGTTKVEIENGVVKASNGFAVPSSSDPTKNVFSVDANGGVKAQSLNLPNANKDPAAKKTVTVNSIDTGSNPTLFEKNALATTEAIRLKAQNSAFSGRGQKSLKDPYGTGAAPTTLKDAINNLATNVDDAFGSIGQYSQLNAQSQIEGSNIHKDDPVVSPDTKSPTLVSAAVDLDNAIGNRALYNNSHYANTTDTKVSVSQAIANMDGAVYQDIHGQGDATTPLKGTVNIGDKAVTTKVGAQDAAGILTGMTVDTATAGSESITFTVTDANAATPAPKDVMTINKDGVNVDGNENVTGKVTVAASSTATSKVEIDSADGSVTSTSTAGTVKLVDGTATASNTVTAGAVDATSGALSGNGVQMKNDGTVTAKNGAETAHYDAAGITLHNGTADTFTVDTTNGDMMAAAGNFAVTTASGTTTMTIGAPAATATTGKVTIDTTGKIESIGSAADKTVTIDDGNVVVSGDTKTTTFTMPDADQPTGATSVVYAQVTGIDVGGATTNTTFSNQALATTQSIKTKAENADYTASDALKAGNYATAQTSVATINNAIESLDLRIGDWDGLHLTPNGNLTNGHAGDAGYNEPETVVEAFNNIDSTLGRIHGLVTENTDGTYTYNMTSGTETRDWTNLAVGTTVEEHVLAVNDAIGNRNGYTAAYNINRGESVAESLNNIDLRLGDVKSLNNMHYYGEQNPNDVNLTGAVRALDNNLYRVEHDLKTLRHETHAGLASAAALSALVPNPRGTGDTTLSFGTGAYQGHTAAALGGFHWITNNLLVNAGVGWDNREATTRIGVSYSF